MENIHLCSQRIKRLFRKEAVLLCVVIVLAPFASFARNGEIYAVCIGVTQYKNAKMNLLNCRRDAVEMHQLLKLKTKEDNLVLLVDDQATHENIVSRTGRLFEKATADDVVIFFFSGHGDEGCFVAHDKKLHFNAIQNLFKKTAANRKMIFADACHSGTLRGGGSRDNARNRDIGKNVLLFLSSRSNQTSIDDPQLRNGAFTFFLMAGLKGGADSNQDRIITARELFDFVNPKVKERSNGSQTPVMWGKFDENMEIIRWTK